MRQLKQTNKLFLFIYVTKLLNKNIKREESRKREEPHKNAFILHASKQYGYSYCGFVTSWEYWLWLSASMYHVRTGQRK